jgi:hypothetical protein
MATDGLDLQNKRESHTQKKASPTCTTPTQRLRPRIQVVEWAQIRIEVQNLLVAPHSVRCGNACEVRAARVGACWVPRSFNLFEAESGGRVGHGWAASTAAKRDQPKAFSSPGALFRRADDGSASGARAGALGAPDKVAVAAAQFIRC